MVLVATERLAELIARGCMAPLDPRTLALWARHAGVGYWTLRERCQMAEVPCLAALRFTRVLRAVFLTQLGQTPGSCCDLLDVGDRRTMSRLLNAVGTPELHSRTIPMAEFLALQTLVQSRALLAEVRRRLVVPPLLPYPGEFNEPTNFPKF